MEPNEKKMQQALDDLAALAARTQGFEHKYGLLSADFYVLYQDGQLDTGDSLRDVTLWAGAYEAQLNLESLVRQLSQQRLAQLRATAAAGEVRLVPDESIAA
jgi:hypothetical protein